MRFCFGLALFLTAGLFAQDKNSLLWEITGNDLQEPSHVYGTMHVSGKIAFRLDDVFYDALYESELIALESDPESWLADRDKVKNTTMGYGAGFIAKGFYQYPFIVTNPTKEILSSYLSLDDRLVNSILYRTNENSRNFEEDTYLDMFIYQAGKKFSKPIVALENLEESSALVGRANMNAMKPKLDEWLQKKMQTQDVLTLLEDAYRERNINLIDSLDQAIYTEHYLNNMLYIRNRNMAAKLDSLVRTAKVFAGIGAAHLPGKNGVIQLLRDKGYTVSPLVSKASRRGLALKDTFENKISINQLRPRSPEDSLFRILLPNDLYPIAEYTNTSYISPDLVNGSYVMINRIPTFSHLKDDERYDLDKIDQLLFENIPGKILEKSRIKNGPYEGLDIKNQLKNGDYQRYHIYITPLEILIFKMGGKGEYVVHYSDTIFNSLNFTKRNTNRSVLVSPFQNFEIGIPSTYHFTNQKRKGNRLIEGVDTLTSDYYFLKKVSLQDFNYIEQDTFELKQIQDRFYEDLNITPKFGPFTDQGLVSSAKFGTEGGKKLYVKTLIRENDYYLLAAISQDSTTAYRYFRSFKIGDRNYTNGFKKIRDTALFFTTVSPIPPPKFVENSTNYYERGKKPKPYSAYTKQTIYQTNDNESVLVNVNKSHDFLMFPHIDSIWNLRKKLYRQKQFNIIREQRPVYNNQYHELNLTLTDTASTRGIIIKNIVKGGLLYELKTVIDTTKAPSRFINDFFEHFTPMDTLIGSSLLQDKTPEFFRALRENDSIVHDGYPFIKFYKKDADSLKYYISEFEFRNSQKYLQAHLIQKLTQLDSIDATDFFETYYSKSYNNSNAQTKILQAIARKQDQPSTALLLRLMSTDLPLVSNRLEIQQIFKPFMDSLPLAKRLYPEILDYSTIEEYKSPIFSLLAKLMGKGLIKPKIYKKFQNQILNDAKLQLKRLLGQTTGQGMENPSRPTLNTNYDILEDYAILLYPFIKENEVAAFFNRLSLVKNPNIRTSYIALLAKKDESLLNDSQKIPKGSLLQLAGDPQTRLLLFQKLRGIGKLNLFPTAYHSQVSIAESFLYNTLKLDPERHAMEFIKDQKMYSHTDDLQGYYFKVKDNDGYHNQVKIYLLVYYNNWISPTPTYINKGFILTDLITEEEGIKLSTEEYNIRDRPRAMVNIPALYGAFEQ